jgi:hypothetical protein
MSNKKTQNNGNRNNQPATAVEVSVEKFHYEELISDQVATLHQERLVQHLDGGLNQWRIMINNGSKSLNKHVQDRQTTSDMCYRREHVTQMC